MATQETEYSETLFHLSERTMENKKCRKTTAVGKALHVTTMKKQ
jgi:hypothetical protein